MRQWVTRQIASSDPPVVTLLDPEGIVSDAEIADVTDEDAQIARVDDWLSLRREWERLGRTHRRDDGPLVIVVSDVEIQVQDDLPFDIATASAVSRIRSPGTPDVRAALKAMDDATSDEAVRRIEQDRLPPVDAVLSAATGLPARALAASPALQFRLVLRLRRRAVVADLVAVAWEVIEDPLAYALLEEPPDVECLQDAWEDWLHRGDQSAWSAHFDDAASEVAELLRDGTLTAVEFDPDGTPAWTRLGLRSIPPDELVDRLLATPPAVGDDMESWLTVAEWWGEVRAGISHQQPRNGAQADSAWAVWAELDALFALWLRQNYGSQLSRSWVEGPRSLDKVKPFLERRLAMVPKVAVIVLDGMAFAQWTQIRSAAAIRVVRAGATLAMLPTLTEVSRQAIAAGALPREFVESLGTTSRERERWCDGLSTRDWLKLKGVELEELSSVPFDAALLSVVVTATDQLLHSSALLGDIGLRAGLDAWLSTGFLDALIARTHAAGYEIWLTSDHGNLEVQPEPARREGVFVDSAGTRVRQYNSHALRDGAAVAGLVWDDLPGLPASESARLLFAPARTAWTSARISHGGLSLDEVIVPFVQVAPA
jgi:hypothetical protein